MIIEHEYEFILLMESLRTSLKTYHSCHKQQEENQALLNDQNEEITVKICTETASNSSSKFPSSSKKLKFSFEDVLNEAVKQKFKHSPDQESPRFSSNLSFRRNSWKSVINKTKSRLIDPPEEQYQRCDSEEFE